MDQKEYKRISLLMLELLFSAEKVADYPKHTLTDGELDSLYLVAQKNGLCAFTAYALNKMGIISEKFKIALARSQQKNILFDAELNKLTAVFEENAVNYLPLKGTLVKQLYPAPYLREMSDIDILFWGVSAERIKEIMLREKYTVKLFQKNNHDVYVKPPFFCIEMHRTLFDGDVYQTISEYFRHKTYTAVSPGSHRCSMSITEMYLYLLAHAYIHYSSAGTGLRTIIDFYYFLKKHASEIDREDIRRQTEQIGLTDFEKMIRNLSKKITDPGTLSRKELSQLDYFIFSGKYGNERNFIRNRMAVIMKKEGYSKRRYILRRLSYRPKNIENSPFYSKHPRLAPLLYLTRPLKAVFTRPKSIIHELKELKK